nr:MAG: hypothetical protein E4H34_00230 [Hyphomicrobiales bacterium]
MTAAKQILVSVSFSVPLLAGCAGGAPVPLTPGTYYVSIALSESRGETDARMRARENADRHCDRYDRKSEILDSRIMEGEGGQAASLDLIFRCGEALDDI